MVPFAIFLHMGGYPLMALTLFITVVGLKEFYSGMDKMGVHPWKSLGYVLVTALYLFYAVLYYLGDPTSDFIMAWVALSVILGSLYMFNVKKRTVEDTMATIIGLVYIGFFAFHVVLVDIGTPFPILKWLIVISAFGSDIFAYFTGMLIGKHKLCPDLSPKKTVEGAVGGVIGSALLSALFGVFFAKDLMVHCVLIGLIASPVSMLGDLTASAYKRRMNIKDYGNLIPGHGGIMDRFDSVLFTAPFVYYYIQIVLVYFLGE
jgi:phosphatidate cytidylyltransferase